VRAVPPVIRRLTTSDAEAFRALRLEALAAHPDAFAASFEQEETQPLAWFAGRLEDSAVFGAFLDSTLTGIMGLQVPDAPKLCHKGVLWTVYVAPAARKSDLALALLRHLLDHAATVVEEVRLSVSETNAAAIALYRKAGFEAYGREPRALKVDGRYFDDLLMATRLGRGSYGG
jgi:ribosomal protein S18 acetylase RimI-like enzyme